MPEETPKLTPYSGTAEQLEDYSRLIMLFIIEYIDKVVKQKAVTDTPFDDYKGLVVSLEEAENAFSTFDFSMSDGGIKRVSALYDQILKRTEITEKSGKILPLEQLCRVFGFAELERLIIVLSLMPLINSDFEKTFGYINDNVNQKFPTLSLALKLFAHGKTNSVAAMEQTLFKYVIACGNYSGTERARGGSVFTSEIKVKKYFSDLLLYGKSLAESDFIREEKGNSESYVCYPEQLDVISSAMKRNNPAIIAVMGKKGSGRRFLVKQCAEKNDCGVLFIDEKALEKHDNINELLDDIVSRLLMRQCYPCIENVTDDEKLSKIIKSISRAARVIAVITDGECPPKPDTDIPMIITSIGELSREKRYEMWLSAGIEDGGFLRETANKYRYTPAQIVRAAGFAKTIGEKVDSTVIDDACHLSSRGLFGDKAELIKTCFTLDDLILPEEEKRQIKEACSHIKYRHIVYDKWNFESRLAYGKGLVLLFAGPPGTGKTMAASIVARELGLDAYRVDISKVMSKYVGETEKSLGEIFDLAESSNAVLFFDETDALFGKRSEIKDSNDKYANVETSFLLQRLESFDGVVLMSTNLLQNIDDAFMRRISYIVHFPFPSEEQRLTLWKSMFPPEMPFDGDIDFDYLSKQFELSGALIKNTVQSAAFLAAEDGMGGVNMGHILRAVKKQLSKQGKVLLDEDFGKYSYYLLSEME